MANVIRRERADPRYHIELTWCSLLALLTVASLAAGLVWAAMSFLPPLDIWHRADYRFMLGVSPVVAYPWLHGRLRRLARR